MERGKLLSDEHIEKLHPEMCKFFRTLSPQAKGLLKLYDDVMALYAGVNGTRGIELQGELSDAIQLEIVIEAQPA